MQVVANDTYYFDGPIYVDLVLTNNRAEATRTNYYPRILFPSMEFAHALEWGSGAVFVLKDTKGQTLEFGSPLDSGYKLRPPVKALGPGARGCWRFPVDLADVHKYTSKELKSDLPAREFEVTVRLPSEDASSLPVKIALLSGEQCKATAAALGRLRKELGWEAGGSTKLEWLVAAYPEKNIDIPKDVLPSFAQTLQAFREIGKAVRGESNLAESSLPTEKDWGLWADEMAALRYELLLKQSREKAAAARAEAEKSYPGIVWLLEDGEKNQGLLCTFDHLLKAARKLRSKAQDEGARAE